MWLEMNGYKKLKARAEDSDVDTYGMRYRSHVVNFSDL